MLHYAVPVSALLAYNIFAMATFSDSLVNARWVWVRAWFLVVAKTLMSLFLRASENLHFLPIPALYIDPTSAKAHGAWRNQIMEQINPMVRYKEMFWKV